MLQITQSQINTQATHQLVPCVLACLPAEIWRSVDVVPRVVANFRQNVVDCAYIAEQVPVGHGAVLRILLPLRGAHRLEATRKEYDLLDKTMGCWEVVHIDTLPEDANLIGVKWVFKIKFKNGEYERHKARIVALGYQQRKDVDYFASFSLTASYVTIRLVLALTALPHWYGVDLDATVAFISAPLPPEEQVYLKAILGFDLPKGKCLRLKKTIYGLVQSSALIL